MPPNANKGKGKSKASEKAVGLSKAELVRMGRAELRAVHGFNTDSRITDELLAEKIQQYKDEVASEVGYEPDLQPGTPGYDAVRFYGLIRAQFLQSTETGPTSISEARRYDYESTDLDYWSSRLIRALSTLHGN